MSKKSNQTSIGSIGRDILAECVATQRALRPGRRTRSIRRKPPRGGDASQIVLPDMVIIGNTHMKMLDNNSEQIANIIEHWIARHVRHVRAGGRY